MKITCSRMGKLRLGTSQKVSSVMRCVTGFLLSRTLIFLGQCEEQGCRVLQKEPWFVSLLLSYGMKLRKLNCSDPQPGTEHMLLR